MIVADGQLALAFGAIFAVAVAVRLLALRPAPPDRVAQPSGDDADLPVFTILVPLFRETRVRRQITSSLLALDYPALGSKRT